MIKICNKLDRVSEEIGNGMQVWQSSIFTIILLYIFNIIFNYLNMFNTFLKINMKLVKSFTVTHTIIFKIYFLKMSLIFIVFRIDIIVWR